MADGSFTTGFYITRWPTKMSLFFFGNNFYKNKETFKIFSPHVLEVYRILLMQTTLESMCYYTFSVIIDMFDPATTPLYDSSNSNIKIVHNSIERFLWNLSDFSSGVIFEDLCCLWILFFQMPPTGNWDLGSRVVRGYQSYAKRICPLGSTAWGIQ